MAWTNTGFNVVGMLVFLPLTLTAWAALRFGVTGTSLAVLALAAISAAGTATGRGPFLQPNVVEGVFLLSAPGAFLIGRSLAGEAELLTLAVAVLPDRVGRDVEVRHRAAARDEPQLGVAAQTADDDRLVH